MDNRGQFTREEIYSQPQAWTEALQVLASQADVLRTLWRDGDYSQVIFTGCGSTYYLALAAAGLLQELSGLPARGLPASELWLYPKSAYPRDGRILLVAISRSGETSETLRACETFLQDQRGDLLTLSCYADMPLAGLGLVNLVFPSGAERSVAQTRAFSTLYLATVYLAATWSWRTDLLEQIPLLPQAGKRLIENVKAQAGSLGRDLGLERFYFLGSGPRHGLACELSLKMKEMTLSHSEPFHFMEFRHGPKSMVTPQTLVFGLVSGTNQPFEQAVIENMQALGGQVLTLGESECRLNFASGLDEAIRSVLYLPAGQIMAFERSIAKGLNPDRPHNLDSVVKLS